jgi:hypothetical protein
MAYSKYGKIEADDLNATLIGPANSSSPSNINSVWATGFGKGGYGQTVSVLAPGYAGGGTARPVLASQWASLINTISAVANHQGTAITAITAPTTGSPVLHYSSLPTNITNVYNGRNNAAVQGSSSTTNTVNSSTWFNAITFTQTVTFASGNAARYFFNAGGQLALTFTHPTGSGINGLFNALGTACGTLVISSPNSGTVSIASTGYNGIQKIGGSGSTTTLLPNVGYWGMTGTNQEVFKQFGGSFTGGSGASYSQNYLSVNVRTNGSQGADGDNGSTITITTLWDESPNGLTAQAGTTVSLTVRPPSTTYLTNSWGTPSVSGSVSGQ